MGFLTLPFALLPVGLCLVFCDTGCRVQKSASGKLIGLLEKCAHEGSLEAAERKEWFLQKLTSAVSLMTQASAMYLPPEPLANLSDKLQTTDALDGISVSDAPDLPIEGSFEEAFGPTELFRQQVPNEGDVQLLAAVNRAIYTSLYEGTESERAERWEKLWHAYEPAEVGINHKDTLPPLHMCSPPERSPLASDKVAGSFKEAVLDPGEFIYLSDFSMPPFVYLTRATPSGRLRLGDFEYVPGRGVESSGILSDIVEQHLAPELAAKYNVPKLHTRWSYRAPSCDFRTAADSLYLDAGSIYVGMATPSSYINRYFATSCPVMMYGKLSLVSGFVRGPRGGVELWNRPGFTIGTLAYLPYAKLVAAYLPKAKLSVYTRLSHLLAAVTMREVHGFLVPSDTARALLASGELCGDFKGGCRIIGNIGKNDRPLVFLLRKYPMDPPYVNSFLDETYKHPTVDCQHFLSP